ncbi:MAG TPA: nucleotidyltransferase family protein [Terriglobales bacterium]|nr:nucleotidyltransferase family protein [Terriglobales bacterium]
MSDSPHITAILLAAGSSRRFGSEKLLASWRGRPLLAHALDALAGSPGIAETIAVVQPSLAAPVAPPRCRFVVNPEHEEGMASSLRAGVGAAPPEADAYLVALADMPEVGPALIAALIDHFRAAGKPIAVPVHRGRRGHPVLIGRTLRSELLALRGDVGARAILEAHPEWVAPFETGDPAVLFDVDAPADLGQDRVP